MIVDANLHMKSGEMLLNILHITIILEEIKGFESTNILEMSTLQILICEIANTIHIKFRDHLSISFALPQGSAIGQFFNVNSKAR